MKLSRQIFQGILLICQDIDLEWSGYDSDIFRKRGTDQHPTLEQAVLPPQSAGRVGCGGPANGSVSLARRARAGRTGAQRPTLHPGAHRSAVRRVGVAVPTRCDPRHVGAERPALADPARRAVAAPAIHGEPARWPVVAVGSPAVRGRLLRAAAPALTSTYGRQPRLRCVP